MKIGIIGTGYVGLPTGIGFAEMGHDVVCCDKNADIIYTLRTGGITLYEDGLEELFVKNVKAGRLTFTTSLKECVSESQVVIIAVGTPPHPVTKEADLKYVHTAAAGLAEYIQQYTVVVIKSTVPVGTGDAVEGLIQDKVPDATFDVVSIPEFLREGFAVHDFFNPDRIVVGTNSDRAIEVIKELYEPLKVQSKMIFVKRRSSEIIKYAANAFLAVKIHYINEMADFCEKTGADIREVAKGMGLDSRIGGKFLNPGPGYGGSCFPKDTEAIAFVAKQNNVELSLINAAICGNHQRKRILAEKVLKMVDNIKEPKIAVMGLAFKEGTDDCRESPAVEIINMILAGEKALRIKLHISAYDPKAISNARQLLGDQINYLATPYKAVKDADLLLILTEWPQFKELDFDKIKSMMRNPVIMDMRNLLDADRVSASGCTYMGIGDGTKVHSNI